jgi:hypothetical protein
VGQTVPHGPDVYFSGGQNAISLYSNVLYQSVLSLVALFARSGTHRANPRAPHNCYQTHAAFSYADVTRKQMEHGHANGGSNREVILQKYL